MTDSLLPCPQNADDWNALWRTKQSARTERHGALYWNERSRTYATKDNPDSYTARFLRIAALKPGDAVLDMGCGTGNLTIPLAEAGHQVCAADFSSGMLARLEVAVKEKGLDDRVRIMELAWDDDWKAAGINEGAFDACFASRSIATDDLLGALRKLNGAARKRCCITLPFGTSPRSDDRMLTEIGLDMEPSYDDAYAIAMLSSLGQHPELTYIPTFRNDIFPDEDAAFERYLDMAREYGGSAQDGIPESELASRIKAWLQVNLIPDAEDPTLLTLKRPRESHWACIFWDKRSTE